MNAFVKLARNRLQFIIFLLRNLPGALFAGVRIKFISEEKCVVTVPYKWSSKNPFRSTYFASLAMAAEMSTGALALSNIYKRSPAVSMLLTEMNGAFHKKAIGITSFICRDGRALHDAIEEAIAAGSSNTITVQSTGTNESGEVVAVFQFTWSFKMRQK
ncbi:MAG TPA: DUF4442 domain-containing protein [Agriterribacter sp.]|nr:DUF4442 domain-containing protein [Chitinophagaceae bacterium]HRP31769.1 DUF4442 domain-containing protein [Agriterribacter sp.]